MKAFGPRDKKLSVWGGAQVDVCRPEDKTMNNVGMDCWGKTARGGSIDHTSYWGRIVFGLSKRALYSGPQSKTESISVRKDSNGREKLPPFSFEPAITWGD